MSTHINRVFWKSAPFVCGSALVACLVFLFAGNRPSIDIVSETGRLSSKNLRNSGVESGSVSSTRETRELVHQSRGVDYSSGPVIESFRNLKLEFSGKELQDRQILFLTIESGKMHGEECVHLFDEAVSSCADQVVFQAANLLGHRLFAGGVDDGLSALALLDNSPGCTLLALHAGASIDVEVTGSLPAEVVFQISNAQDIEKSVKTPFIEGCMQAALAKGCFGKALAEEALRLISVGLMEEGKLASVIGMASIGTDFDSMVNGFGGSNPRLVSSAYFAWGRVDPESCAKALQQPENIEELRNHAGALVSGWYDNSPQDVSVWVQNLPDEEARDKGSSALALKLLQLSPREALAWAGSISNEAERVATLKRLKISYLKLSDSDSARDLFQSSLSVQDFERVGFSSSK